MNLDEMKLTDLEDFQSKIDTLIKAGTILQKGGLQATFAVSEWTPALTVPPIGSMIATETRQITEVKPQQLTEPPRICKDGPRMRQTESTAEVQSSPLDPVALPEGAAPFRDESAPVETPRDADSKPLVGLPSPGNRIKQSRPIAAAYTEQEISWAVVTYLDMIGMGCSRKETFEAIGMKLGRKAAAIETRFYSTWDDLVRIEKSKREAEKKPTAQTPAVEAWSARPWISEDPLVQRITTLRMPSQWDFAADLRMLRMSADGLDPKTIAVTMEVPPKIIMQRMAQLTDTDRYTASEVWNAVRTIVEDQKRGKVA